MSIRIWHQSFTVLSDLGPYDDALKAHFAKVARPDTIIDQHGMRPGTYRTNYPGDDIKFSSLQYLHGLQFLTAAVAADVPKALAGVRYLVGGGEVRREP